MGVVELGAAERFVLADLPGLIEGASEGAGLGHRFLGHVERCAAIIHLVDGTADNPAEDYAVIRKELINYNESLTEKPEIVVITKCDSIPTDRISEIQTEIEALCGQTPLLISSVAQSGLKPVLSAVFQHVDRRRKAEKAAKDARIEAEAVAAGIIEEKTGWQP